MLNVSTQQVTQVANHDGPIIGCRVVDPSAGPAGNMLVTTSWDKTVKYWDLRQSNPVSVVQLPERPYSMDTKGRLLVIACGGSLKKVQIFDLQNPQTIFKV